MLSASGPRYRRLWGFPEALACVAVLCAVLLIREMLFVTPAPSEVPAPLAPTPTSPTEVVFFAIGDWGMARHHQEEVSRALGRAAREIGPEFVLSLGDNFYPIGVRSVEDPQWQARFEDVYTEGHLRAVPWHITLGDHDHQGSVDAQIRYSQRSPRWKLPAPYYTMKKGGTGDRPSIHFTIADSVGLEGAFLQEGDTRRFAKNLDPKYTSTEAGEEQRKWLPTALSEGDSADWNIAVGHRPVVTGGLRDRTAVENRTALGLREILLASNAQLWMNGHDHTMQCLQEQGDASALRYVVNGGGGYRLHNVSKLKETVFAGSFHGFLVCRVSKETFKIEFHDTHGTIRYTLAIPNKKEKGL